MLSSTTSARIISRQYQLLALVVPPLLELDGEAVVGRLDPLDPDLSRERVTGDPRGDDVLGGRGLDPPLRQRQVGENVRCEQPVRDGAGLQEPDQLRDRGRGIGPRATAWRWSCRCRDPARFAPTTAIVASRSAVGLNSTMAVPAVTSGRWPGGA